MKPLAPLLIAPLLCALLLAGLATASAQSQRVKANTTRISYEGDAKLIRAQFVDGMAFKSGETELAFLTQKRLSACTRLAVLVRNETELGRLAKEYGSLVLLKRDREYPQGSLMEVDPVVASIMSDSTPSMKIDDKGLQLAGSFGEIGKDMITMQLLKKPEPMVTIDVMLP